MAVLARAVHVKDPKRPGRTILLAPGEEPAPELAIQVRNSAAWEGGKFPTAVRRHLAAQQKRDQQDQDPGPEDKGQGNNGGGDTPPVPGSGDTPPTEPAAPAKAAAKKPAPRRTAAAEGTGGQ